MTAQQYIDQNRETFLQLWFEALRIPSVSADPEHKGDMAKMAQWLCARLEKIGLSARLIPTGGNPLVFAESKPVPGKPVILVYGHYDVQPADPLSEWLSEPFEPQIRDGWVYGRGADDDKGQSLAHLFGAETLLAVNGELPVQLKFIYEGEEETGSESLAEFLTKEENRALLACDAILVSDTDMAGPETPAITYGLRGILGCELELTGPNRDLHSGLYGGSVTNPAIALCSMLGSLIDPQGRIQIPGFYDDVAPISKTEHAAFAERPFDQAQSYEAIGLSADFGEPEYTVLERRGARPTFDINGLTSGYQGEGGKTIIPSKASAKITFRMVPNQQPGVIFENLRAFLTERLWPGLKMNLKRTSLSGGFLVPLESPYIQAASAGLAQTFGKKPIFIRDGGSIPVIAELAVQLKTDTVLAGLGLEEDGIHSPNERYGLEAFYQGISASAAILTEFGKIDK